MNIGKLAKTLKGVVDKQGDKIASGVDKATDFVDKKTKGKYTEKLEKVDKLADKLDKNKGGERAAAAGPAAAAGDGAGTEQPAGDATEEAPPAPPPASS